MGTSRKSLVDRQPSPVAARGAADLTAGARAPLATRLPKRIGHWVFSGYLALTVISFPYTWFQARRFDASLTRLRTCLARADAGCANLELEAARRIRSTDVRMEIADASLAVLLHQVDRAEVSEATLENRGKQQGSSFGGEIRADLLLLRGDIALAKGNQLEARDDFAAARPLLNDPGLVSERLQRIDALERSTQDHNVQELESLAQDFSDLFASAAQGNRDILELRADKAQEWIARVPHQEARHALSLAVNAARRACNVVENENRSTQGFVEREPPKPPVRGAYDYSAGYVGSYDAQLAVYRDRLERYNKERAAADLRQAQRAAKAAEASSAAIAQGRQLLEDALAILRALPRPLTEAASAVPAREGGGSVVTRHSYSAGFE